MNLLVTKSTSCRWLLSLTPKPGQQQQRHDNFHHFNPSFRWLLLLLIFINGLVVKQLISCTNIVHDSTLESKLSSSGDINDNITSSFQKNFTYQESAANRIEIGGETIESQTTFYTNENLDIRNITEDDLILEALDKVYMTRFKQPYLLDYDRIEDRRQSSDRKLINEQRCLQEITYLYDRLNELESAREATLQSQKTGAPRRQPRLHPELAVLFDSYGGSENGLLLGNYHWLGQWEQCNRRHIFDLLETTDSETGATLNNKLIDFTGRSCVVSLRNPNWDKKILIKTRELNESNYFKYPEQHLDYGRYFRIQVGACLPQSCDSNILMDKLMPNETHRQMLRKLTLHRVRRPQSDYNLTSIYCIPDESSPLRQLDTSGWLFVSVTLLWLLSMVGATIADVYDLVGLGAAGKKTLVQKIVVSLSLRESYRTLVTIGGKRKKKTTTEQHSTRPADLTFLHAIKVVIMWPILFGHVAMISLMLSKYSLDYDQMSRLVIALLTASSFYVDWFFCITALITTYSMFATNIVKTNTPIQWLYSVFHRYWRLMPMYLYVFWFGRSVFHLMGSGAFWDYGTSTMGFREVCKRESWLVPLTLTPNFHPIPEECIMPAWYIGTDMQFYLVTPPLLVLLSKAPKLGWLAGLATMSLSNLLRYHRYMTDEKARPIDLIRLRADLTMRINWDLHPTYLYPQYRIASYIVGILAGHYIYMVRSGQWSSPLYSGPRRPTTGSGSGTGSGQISDIDGLNGERRALKWRLAVGLVGLYLAIVLSFSCFIGDELFPRSLEPHARGITAALYATTPTLAAMAPACISAALMLGLWPWVKAKLENRWWIWLSRLNFFVFLLQVEVLVWFQQAALRQQEMYLLFEFQTYAAVKPILYVLSFIGTILMANPLARLETELLGVHMVGNRRTKRQDKKTTRPGQSAEGSRLVDQTSEEQQHCQNESMVMMSISNNGSSGQSEPLGSISRHQQQADGSKRTC